MKCHPTPTDAFFARPRFVEWLDAAVDEALPDEPAAFTRAQLATHIFERMFTRMEHAGMAPQEADPEPAPTPARDVRTSLEALNTVLDGPISFPVVHRETGAPAGEVTVEPGKPPEVKLLPPEVRERMVATPPWGESWVQPLDNRAGRIHYLDVVLERQKQRAAEAPAVPPQGDDRDDRTATADETECAACSNRATGKCRGCGEPLCEDHTGVGGRCRSCE